MTDRAELAERVEFRRRLRERLLLAVYEWSNAQLGVHGRFDYGGRLQGDEWPEAEVEAAARWLEEAGLVTYIVAGKVIGLTARGVEQAETLITPADDPLAPLSVLELRRIEAFASDLQRAVDEDRIPGDDEVLQEIRDLLRDLQEQASRRPRKGIIGAMLGVVGGLLMGVGSDLAADVVRAHGAQVAQEFAKRIPDLFDR